jgi:YidC/Oxa1 family membrane protein insertase
VLGNNKLDSNKRSALAVLICIMFIMVYTQLFIQPIYDDVRRSSQQNSQQGQVVSNAGTATNVTGVLLGPATNSQASGSQVNGVAQDAAMQANSDGVNSDNRVVTLPTVEQIAKAPRTTFSNGDVTVEFNHLGARLQHVWLEGYKRSKDSNEALDLLEGNELTRSLPGRLVRDASLNDDGVNYVLKSIEGLVLKNGVYVFDSSGEVPSGEGRIGRFVFEGVTSSGIVVEKIFSFQPKGYKVALSGRFDVVPVAELPIRVEWSHHSTNEEMTRRIAPHEFSYVVKGEGDSHSFTQVFARQLKDNEARPLSKVQWIGFGDTYFLQALSKPENGSVAAFGVVNDSVGATFFWSMAGEPTEVKVDLFLGPKSRSILQEAGNDLWRAVDLGMFAVVAEPLTWLLKALYVILGNYGLAIIALTLLVKLVLYPFAKHSFDSMSKMQEIQPELKRIQEQYKDDQARLQQEMMALYKRKGVNPMGGCLPMLLQIPVFLGLYNSLLKAIELRHEPFALWINDLSAPEYLNIMGIGVPVMILLMGASMIWQQWTTPSTVDPQQKQIMMLMPVVFAAMFIIFPMPSGLVLYWLVNNIISIVQQKYMRSNKEANPLLATLVASGGIFALGFVLTLI